MQPSKIGCIISIIKNFLTLNINYNRIANIIHCDIKYQYSVNTVVYVTRVLDMKTAHVRINIELKERLENAMRQYRHKTGENITISDIIKRLLMEPDFKLFVEWDDIRTHED